MKFKHGHPSCTAWTNDTYKKICKVEPRESVKKHTRKIMELPMSHTMLFVILCTLTRCWLWLCARYHSPFLPSCFSNLGVHAVHIDTFCRKKDTQGKFPLHTTFWYPCEGLSSIQGMISSFFLGIDWFDYAALMGSWAWLSEHLIIRQRAGLDYQALW